MNKLTPDYENVVIGSRTLEEYRFQVVNFMNMLWDNIERPGDQKCMTVDVVTHNLKFEINRVISEMKIYIPYAEEEIWQRIGTIQRLIKQLTECNFSKYKHPRKMAEAEKEWEKLLNVLTNWLKLTYTR